MELLKMLFSPVVIALPLQCLCLFLLAEWALLNEKEEICFLFEKGCFCFSNIILLKDMGKGISLISLFFSSFSTSSFPSNPVLELQIYTDMKSWVLFIVLNFFFPFLERKSYIDLWNKIQI